MSIRRAAGILAFAAVAAASPPTHAQTCTPFTDVAFGSAFCDNVRWVRNREITLGCTSATTYCPFDAVSRLSMAAFMNRAGNVVTPTVVSTEGSGGPLASAQQHILCITPDVPGRDYGRFVLGEASFSFDVTGATDAGTTITYSRNGGPFTGNVGSGGSSAKPGDRNHHYVIGADTVNLVTNPTDTYRFAIQVYAGVTHSIANWTCQLSVTVLNQVQ